MRIVSDWFRSSLIRDSLWGAAAWLEGAIRFSGDLLRVRGLDRRDSDALRHAEFFGKGQSAEVAETLVTLLGPSDIRRISSRNSP